MSVHANDSCHRAVRLFFVIAAVLLAALAAPAGAGQVKLADSGKDAERRLTVENDFLKLVIDPSCGGQVVSLVYKPSGQEMTCPPADTAMGGLLSDGVYEQSYWHGDWDRAPYKVEILKQDAGVVEVRLWAVGRLWKGLTIAKTIRVRADSPVVEADYEFSPGADSNPRAKPDFWFHQTLDQPGRVFIPSPTGVVEGPVLGQEATSVFEPTSGWAAFVSDKGVAMGATMEFARLRFVAAEHRGQRTLEWVMRKAAMAPKSPVIKTTVRLAFFAGLERVDGVNDAAAVAIILGTPDGGGLPVTVKVAGLSPQIQPGAVISLEVVKLGTDRVVKLPEQQTTQRQGETTVSHFSAPVSGDGTYVIRGVLGGGAGGLKFERSIVIGEPSGVYTMAPEGPIISDVDDFPTGSRYKPIDLNFNRLGYVTPHRDWARPNALGKLRVLALMDKHEARQAVELAERFDLDLTCPFITNDTYFWLGDGVKSLRQSQVDANIEEAAARDYDVVLVSNSGAWGMLSKKVKTRLVEMLNGGTGWLVIGSGDNMPEVSDKLPLTGTRQGFAAGCAAGDSTEPLLHGLALSVIPPFTGYGMKLRAAPNAPPAQVLLKTSGFPAMPLAATAQVGKGRLAQIAWGAPILPSEGSQVQRPLFDYWEYQYQVIGRLLYWAGRKESPVRIASVQAKADGVTVSLDPSMSGPASVHVTLRDRFGQALHEADLPVTLTAGQTASVELKPPADAAGDCFLADAVVSDAPGALDFGSGAFPSQPVKIDGFKTDKRVYNSTDQAELGVELSVEPPAGSTLRLGVYDGSGRCAAVVTAAAQRHTQVQLPLARVIGPMFEARAELATPQGVANLAACTANIRVPRPDNRFLTFYWNGALNNMPPYMTMATIRRYRETGMNASFDNIGVEDFFDRFNMPFREVGSGMSFGGGTTLEAAQKNPKAKGGMFDPALVKIQFNACANAGKEWADRNMFDYHLGDEQKGPGKDVDFSSDSLAEFRQWLSTTQYKSLDDLNANWKTAFKSWDEVMPMTEAQVKTFGPANGSYGAWVDQRNFNAYMYAKLGEACTQGALSTDPRARAAPSGTQEEDTYSSQDWWLLSRAYNEIVAYGGLQTNEQMTYNPGMIYYSWSGYSKPNPGHANGFWGLLGKNDKGFGVFSAPCYIEPDFTLCEAGRDLRLAMFELNNGAAQFLADAAMVNDQVMVLQSPSSLELSDIIGQRELSHDSRYGVIGLMDGLGLVYNPISYEQLSTGYLAKAGPKALFLSQAIALSPEDVAAVTRWVEQGGTLVADLQPGIMNYHGLVMPKGQLDELMGVDRAGAKLVKGKWEVGSNTAGQVFPAGTVEAGVKPAGAQALWTAKLDAQAVPVVYHRKVGKGHTYYLAFDALGAHTAAMSRIGDPAGRSAATACQRLFSDILAGAGVRPRMIATITKAPAAQTDGPVVCPYMLIRPKTLGPAQVYVVERNYAAGLDNQAVQLGLAQGGYIYDVIAGRLLGHGDKLDLTPNNATVRVLAVLPYLVTGMRLDVAGEQGVSNLNAKPGQDVSFNAALEADGHPTFGPHVFHVDVVRPDGSPDDVYSGDIEVPEGGQAKVTIKLGLNDPQGVWRVRVHDAATGVAAETTMTVSR